MHPSLLPLLALSTRAVIGATILDALQTVDQSTNSLDEAATNWNGGLLGTLPIIKASTVLLTDIKEGERTAEASPELTFDEALALAGATISLSESVNSTLQTFVDRKKNFDKLLLSPVILGTLKVQQSATEDFSNAILEKVPEEASAIADELIAEILKSFDVAVDAYSLF